MNWKNIETLSKKGYIQIVSLVHRNRRKNYLKSYFRDTRSDVIYPITKQKFVMGIEYYIGLGAIDKRNKLPITPKGSEE